MDRQRASPACIVSKIVGVRAEHDAARLGKTSESGGGSSPVPPADEDQGEDDPRRTSVNGFSVPVLCEGTVRELCVLCNKFPGEWSGGRMDP